ncbi:MAG: hypothetical protein LBR83_08860, partial [Clostridiales bacterium]|nr:hypothetical protein [Clostridiales bacterium]
MSKQIEDTIMEGIMELVKGDAVKFFGIDKIAARGNLRWTFIKITIWFSRTQWYYSKIRRWIFWG